MNIHTSSNDNFTKLNTVTVLLQITFLSITYDVTLISYLGKLFHAWRL